jgi:hypothetical protein
MLVQHTLQRIILAKQGRGKINTFTTIQKLKCINNIDTMMTRVEYYWLSLNFCL